MRWACIVCGRPTASPDRRCPAHPLADRPERGNAGASVRADVLERDLWTCQLRLEGCEGRADTVHHLKRHRDGGAFTRENLVAACGHCNSSETPR